MPFCHPATIPRATHQLEAILRFLEIIIQFSIKSHLLQAWILHENYSLMNMKKKLFSFRSVLWLIIEWNGREKLYPFIVDIRPA